ncbi:MAG TPA: zinc ribbon domain-containing protein [Dissulfurispiraceae bacterium]|nr:zinc ribbon domain-containing protein [Dissulfurispiraceae bacterium]
MPIYEYGCTKCGKTHEIMQKFSDAPLSVCPDCGGKVKKMISNTSFVLKGTGWYATDYASGKSGAGEKNASDKPEARSDETGKGESMPKPKTENKSESKTESKKEEVAAK